MTDQRSPPWPDDARYLHLNGLVIDLCYRRACVEGIEVELRHRIFDLLLLLMSEPHTLHRRTDLLERVWPGVIVEDANLSQSIWLLRRVLGDERKQWIRTVPRSGYVFDAPAPVQWSIAAPCPPSPVAIAKDFESDITPETDDVLDGAIAPVDVATAALQQAVVVSAEAADASPPRVDDRILAPLVDADVGPAIEPEVGPAVAQEAEPPFQPAAPLPHVSAAARPAASRPRWLRAGTWMVFALVAAVMSFWATRSAGPATSSHASTTDPRSFVLIEVEDRANPVRWPVKLLREWLGWKLDSLPEVRLLSESDLAADTNAQSPQVIFLTAGSAPNDPSQVVMRVRLPGAGKEQRLELTGPASQVPAMVDQLSRQVMSRLLPQRADPWPPLVLDSTAARRYADAVEAIDRRDWMTAAAISQEVVQQAPRFGLARMQLAQAQSRLAQGISATGHMQAATTLLQPAPAEVVALMRAKALAADPQRHQQAAAAFATLSARYPDKSGYALEHARLLSQTGNLQQSLKILSAPRWERESMGVRIARLLALSGVHQMLGDPERMRQDAASAERLARDAGTGWELERGSAMLQAAIADTVQYEDRDNTRQYEQAAAQLESAGNATLALYARFLSEVATPPQGADNPRMENLLTQARAGGYRRLEIDILAKVAGRHFAAGDLVTYRKRLDEALLASRDSGDALLTNRLTLALLVEDIVGGRFDVADKRLQHLRQARLQGHPAVALAQLDAALDTFRGRHLHSIATLDGAERALAPQQAGPGVSEPQARLACFRAESRLSLGDLASARSNWERCAASDEPSNRMTAIAGRARTELLAGDRDGARKLLRSAQEQLPTMTSRPEGWESAIQIATVLTRTGNTVESDRLYRQALSPLRSAGYEFLVAHAETGLAENAAARGEWATSRHHGLRARRALPADAWSLHRRLDALDIAQALSRGDRRLALALASRLDAKARRLGDVLAQMEIHSLLPRDALAVEDGRAPWVVVAARAGVRGATLGWLNLPPRQDTTALLASAR
ncbi:winged helix-turn-helix domain-containing protein [Montanilutibacter psychrotolerans]|uniref:winged helix-turn-helix domain-containing protein n=1 Tax=Montanilutibacter psychrotolerans TaxID=1327343 RepID=UPI0011CD719F|nr:winged helix-turn-helix domain-containing protein [Lysobacter psychrotolerans]